MLYIYFQVLMNLYDLLVSFNYWCAWIFLWDLWKVVRII